LKRVLITGANSYVGTNVEKWLMREPNKYNVETLDMKSPNWKDFDFSIFDVVFHVAGIAHVSTKKSMKDLYFKVNRDLAIETAEKARDSGVKQFIFMSSMIVYSSKETRITLDTKTNPDNFYGLSKLSAENGLLKLESNDFKVCILRPPMIYGPNSKGNFSKLLKFIDNAIVFPDFPNKKSIIFIDNLSEIVKFSVDNEVRGILYPHNVENVSTTQIAKIYSLLKNKNILFLKLFNIPIKMAIKITYVRKIFGDFYYDDSTSCNYDFDNFADLQSSLIKTVSNHE
jgi:UDP-glucose 4-epimerase